MAARRAASNVIHTTPDGAGLRVIVCVAFNRNAPPDQVSALKKAVVACPSTLHAVEVTGTFDFLMELAVPDVATFNERLNFVAASVANLVQRYEVNFVSKRFVHRNGDGRAIWVQCEKGMKRIDASVIDKVTAEGDYMRVHSNGGSWILHATMRSIVERLGPEDFVQIHRSAVVRTNFIDHLVQEGGRWVASLHDGTCERVAKSHVVDALNHVRTD